MSKIIGVTVGTPIDPAAVAKKIKPVKTINGIEPDADGNVKIEVTNGKRGSIDPTAYGLPVLKLTGDVQNMTKENPVMLAYEYGDKTGTAEVKWQGNSSLSYPKKNYTIKFDNAFEAAEGWGEQTKYCLKANYIDFSHARNVVCAKLWGEIVKSRSKVPEELNGLPNGGAVDGFPICIMVNGVYQGLYTWNIPKDKWMFGMGSGTQECILCAEGHWQVTRFTEEALCDGSDFSIEYVSDKDNAAWVPESLNRLINACINSDGSDIDTTISKYVDIDSAIDFFIFTSLISGSDNYDKNYLLATFDGVKWYFSPYDMDSVFGNKWTGKGYNEPATAQPRPEWYAANHTLMKRLAEGKTEKIKRRYAELRSGVLSESSVFTKFSNFIAGIPSVLYEEDPKIWPLIPGTKTNNLAQIATNYMLRTPMCDKQVDAFVPKVFNYTNLLPTMIDPTTGEVLNGVGYVTDVSADGAPYPDDKKSVMTGLFSYSIADRNATYEPIYIKAPGFVDGFRNASIHFFDSAREYKWSNLKDVTQDDGTIGFYGFTLTELSDHYYKLDCLPNKIIGAMGTSTRYLRFWFMGTVDGLVVTVGEPIE